MRMMSIAVEPIEGDTFDPVSRVVQDQLDAVGFSHAKLIGTAATLETASNWVQERREKPGQSGGFIFQGDEMLAEIHSNGLVTGLGEGASVFFDCKWEASKRKGLSDISKLLIKPASMKIPKLGEVTFTGRLSASAVSTKDAKAKGHTIELHIYFKEIDGVLILKKPRSMNAPSHVTHSDDFADISDRLSKATRKWAGQPENRKALIEAELAWHQANIEPTEHAMAAATFEMMRVNAEMASRDSSIADLKKALVTMGPSSKATKQPAP